MKTTLCPHENHMLSTCKPCSVHLETMWCLHENNMLSTCKPHGVYVDTTWFLHGHHVVAMWTQHSYHMDTTWFPGKHHMVSMWLLSDREGHGHKAVLYKSQFPPLRHSFRQRHRCIHRLINHVYTKGQATFVIHCPTTWWQLG